jgi:hypothetical protein
MWSFHLHFCIIHYGSPSITNFLTPVKQMLDKRLILQARSSRKEMHMHAGNPCAADYVVVGSGSAGAVMAARLSENADVRVILLEAGGTDNSLLIRMPRLGTPQLELFDDPTGKPC